MCRMRKYGRKDLVKQHKANKDPMQIYSKVDPKRAPVNPSCIDQNLTLRSSPIYYLLKIKSALHHIHHIHHVDRTCKTPRFNAREQNARSHLPCMVEAEAQQEYMQQFTRRNQLERRNLSEPGLAQNHHTRQSYHRRAT